MLSAVQGIGDIVVNNPDKFLPVSNLHFGRRRQTVDKEQIN